MEATDTLPEGQTPDGSTETPPVVKSPVKVDPQSKDAVERLIDLLKKPASTEPPAPAATEETQK